MDSGQIDMIKARIEASTGRQVQLLGTVLASASYTSAEQPFNWFVRYSGLQQLDADRFHGSDHGFIEFSSVSEIVFATQMESGDRLNIEVVGHFSVPDVQFSWETIGLNAGGDSSGLSNLNGSTQNQYFDTPEADGLNDFVEVMFRPYDSNTQQQPEHPWNLDHLIITKFRH